MMDIYNIIPNNDSWKISKGIVYKKYLVWMPIINTNNNCIELYFDVRLSRDILNIIPKMGSDFYLISPIFSDPKNKNMDIEEVHKINMLNCVSNYANPKFFYGFNRIEFDLIGNLIKYCKKYDTMLFLKEICDSVNKEIQSKGYDYYANTSTWDFPEDIREEFSMLYRQIKLAELLN